jgi:hypothetical protein
MAGIASIPAGLCAVQGESAARDSGDPRERVPLMKCTLLATLKASLWGVVAERRLRRDRLPGCGMATGFARCCREQGVGWLSVVVDLPLCQVC